jgi:hypothetical protein
MRTENQIVGNATLNASSESIKENKNRSGK